MTTHDKPPLRRLAFDSLHTLNEKEQELVAEYLITANVATYYRRRICILVLVAALLVAFHFTVIPLLVVEGSEAQQLLLEVANYSLICCLLMTAVNIFFQGKRERDAQNDVQAVAAKLLQAGIDVSGIRKLLLREYTMSNIRDVL